MNNQIIYKNTFLNYLSRDLIEYIWSFNYEIASKIIQYYSRIFIKNKINEISKILTPDLSAYNISENYSIFYKKQVLKRNDIFKTLIICKCCSRHNTNKPKKIEPWIETPFNSRQYTPDTSICLCPCRHLSRSICRRI